MREIKFRAVTRENKVIHDVGCIEFFTDGTIIVNGEIPVKELIQYTGLKAKNGDIYEGDLVEFEYISHMNIVKRRKRVVFYDETFARFSTAQENDEDGEYLDEGCCMKILGNIY